MRIIYNRPDLTDQQKQQLALTAHQINMMHDLRKRLAYLIAMVVENARLTAEVNEHRAARGIDPLPTYDPKEVKG